MYESEIAFFDQIQQRQSAIEITPGYIDDESEVAFDHALPRRFVAKLCQSRDTLFVIRAQEWRDPNLVQILLCRV
jgi:hypothetical protein